MDTGSRSNPGSFSSPDEVRSEVEVGASVACLLPYRVLYSAVDHRLGHSASSCGSLRCVASPSCLADGVVWRGMGSRLGFLRTRRGCARYGARLLHDDRHLYCPWRTGADDSAHSRPCLDKKRDVDY